MENVSHDPRPTPLLPYVATYPGAWSEEEAEAIRLAVLRTASEVRECITEGLAVLHSAERDGEYQLFVAGLRKLLVGGLSAKALADAMIESYGSEHEGSL